MLGARIRVKIWCSHLHLWVSRSPSFMENRTAALWRSCHYSSTWCTLHFQDFLKLIPRPWPKESLIHLKMSNKFLSWRNLGIFILTRSHILTDSKPKDNCFNRFLWNCVPGWVYEKLNLSYLHSTLTETKHLSDAEDKKHLTERPVGDKWDWVPCGKWVIFQTLQEVCTSAPISLLIHGEKTIQTQTAGVFICCCFRGIN